MRSGQLVSFIVPNFNGADYIERCLDSIEATNGCGLSKEVLVVDNGSTDGSVSLARGFKGVSVVELGENRGFSFAVNEGIKRSGGELVAIINSDAVLDGSWLSRLYEVLLADHRAGAVSSLVVFDTRFIMLTLRSHRPLEPHMFAFSLNGVLVDCGVFIKREASEVLKVMLPFRKSSATGVFSQRGRSESSSPLDLAGDQSDVPISVGLILREERPLAWGLNVSLRLADGREKELKVCGRDFGDLVTGAAGSTLLPSGRPLPIFEWQINASELALFDVVNSYGCEVTRLGYARDRFFGEVLQEMGTRLCDVEEVFSVPATAVLARRKLFDEVGLFDDSFFAYYEDVDLFWRARLRGWRFYVTPRSVVRHIHAAVLGQWSEEFSRHVHLNRLVTLCKNAPGSMAVTAILRYLATALLFRRPLGVRMWVISRFLLMMPQVVRVRAAIRRPRTVSDSEIRGWFRT